MHATSAKSSQSWLEHTAFWCRFWHLGQGQPQHVDHSCGPAVKAARLLLVIKSVSGPGPAQPGFPTGTHSGSFDAIKHWFQNPTTMLKSEAICLGSQKIEDRRRARTAFSGARSLKSSICSSRLPDSLLICPISASMGLPEPEMVFKGQCA